MLRPWSQEASTFPDWGKMEFHRYPAKPWSELLPSVSEQGRDLVSRLVRYESGSRMTASEVGVSRVLSRLTL